MKITPEQRRKIFGLQRQYGIEEDNLRSIVEQISGDRSISALTKEQAIKVIDRLCKLVGEAPKPREHRATDAMLGKIRQLEKELGWADEPKRLQGFVKKLTGVDRIGWLTKQQGMKVIEALKKMRDRGYQRAAP
ncbi:regulatory protein GemA [Paenibacillus sp. DYY-L-2]|uniref:regulatory protein GemA n=1 Tax=Paenibacillus sp. DYY-L-2 TaxID=3447013 RepID=UPI003F4FC805